MPLIAPPSGGATTSTLPQIIALFANHGRLTPEMAGALFNATVLRTTTPTLNQCVAILVEQGVFDAAKAYRFLTPAFQGS